MSDMVIIITMVTVLQKNQPNTTLGVRLRKFLIMGTLCVA